MMLTAWPVISLVMFWRMPYARALVWTILGGYLLLPPVAAFDFGIMPSLNKGSIPNLSALFITAIILKRRVLLRRKSTAIMLIMLLVIISPVATTLTNGDAYFSGSVLVPGMPGKDAIAILLAQGIQILPFFLARRYLASPVAHREILHAFAIGGLAYSIPMLIEIRLSPQLNTWIYGFFQHSFLQQIRYGGYRPVVFLEHGLWVSFFALTSLLAFAGLARVVQAGHRGPYLLGVGYLGVVLVLCKSAGALVYAAVMLPVALLAGRRTQIHISTACALLVLLYPLLRSMEIVPVNALVEHARSFDAERAESLKFRLDSEVSVLQHASKRPLFGWGGWGRSSLWDDVTGESDTVMDGYWIIVISAYGWCGYLARFGLLTLPLLLLGWKSFDLPAKAISQYSATLALLLGINVVDLLPNATLISLTWLIAGALFGYAESLNRVLPGTASHR
jgi:hypothetical protein